IANELIKRHAPRREHNRRPAQIAVSPVDRPDEALDLSLGAAIGAHAFGGRDTNAKQFDLLTQLRTAFEQAAKRLKHFLCALDVIDTANRDEEAAVADLALYLRDAIARLLFGEVLIDKRRIGADWTDIDR